tara:strand:+ start:9678 stop:9962 length:285 start_codon:yes stop_codon:yes gene_type:complete
MYFFRGAIPVAAFAAPCLPWGLLNPIHGIQNSEKIHFSYSLFLTSLFLNLVVSILILLARVVLGGFAADGCLRALLSKVLLFFYDAFFSSWDFS